MTDARGLLRTASTMGQYVEVLDICYEPLTAREIADRTEVSISSVYKHLRVLRAVGLVEEAGRDRTGDPGGQDAVLYRRTADDLEIELHGERHYPEREGVEA